MAQKGSCDLNCVAQRVVEHFEGAKGHGLTPTRYQKIQEWEDRVHETGATVVDVAKLGGSSNGPSSCETSQVRKSTNTTAGNITHKDIAL